MTGLPAHTKMTGALVSPEMQVFVQKDMPQVRQSRTDPRIRSLVSRQLHRRLGQLTASLVCLNRVT